MSELKMSITTEEIIRKIRKYYKGIIKVLDEAEQEYNLAKNNIKKRETYQFVAAQEMAINDFCNSIGIELSDDDMEIIEENCQGIYYDNGCTLENQCTYKDMG